MRKRTKKIIIVTILSLIVLCGLIALFRYFKAENEVIIRTGQNMFFDEEYSATDSLIFKTDELKNLHMGSYVTSNVRDKERHFDYKGPGDITYTTIKLNEDKPLSEVLFMRNEEAGEVKGLTGFYSTPIRMRAEKVGEVDSIICSYTGVTSEMREYKYTDDFWSFYLPTQTFSIRYGENEPVDMSRYSLRLNAFGIGKRPAYPFVFAFYKKGRTIYFLTYTFFEGHKLPEFVDTDIFGKIVNW